MSSSSGADLEKYFIPLDEINRATDNFSRERYIGGGGFGGVYKGQLSEHWQNQTIAVKRLDADSHQGNREFRNELEIISRFHHENIITFVGYCDEGVEMIIVYEYASNGSLDHHLQDPNKMSCITWAQRLEICIGAARGLHYLHSGLGEKHRVIHRDVKSANILLDDNMVAKICDFGLSKLGARNQPDTQRYTKVAGTQFYLDPSYLESGILQKESDVYSFGVVLFEILSGMLVYSERRIGGERQPLMNSVRRFHENEPDKVVDPRIRDQIKSLSFETFKLTAYECINFKKTDRPTLDTVIKKLEDALNFQMYEHPASTPACGSLIESIIGNLNSVTPYDHRIASNEICLRTKHCEENRVAFGQAGAIPRLTHLLTTPDSRTQEQALMALNYLSLHKGNHGIIVSSLDVLEIIRTLEKGSKEAQEHAAAIYNLYVIRPGSTITSQGAIPPLMLMLGEGTTTGKMNAAVSLLDLCKTSVNRERVLRAGVVPVLMELLKEPQVELKEMYLSIIRELFRHPEGKLAIGEAEAVRHLLEFIGSGTDICDNYAVAVLDELCSMDEKYLVEAQEYGAMEKLKYVRTAYAKGAANEIQNKIKYRQLGALKYFFDKITNIHL